MLLTQITSTRTRGFDPLFPTRMCLKRQGRRSHRKSTLSVSTKIWLKQKVSSSTGGVDTLCFNENLIEPDGVDLPWEGRLPLFELN